ncbi:MAG: PfkB family carbohydrate kinase [Coprococcus sp.]
MTARSFIMVVLCREVVDTMGAGDSFIAGFLYAICEGKGIQEAMADGAANSSVTIAYSGAW